MTRKDYQLIATAINDAYNEAERPQQVGIARCAGHLAAALKADNERFDEERFFAACFPPEDE